jgi:hypothetical protein
MFLICDILIFDIVMIDNEFMCMFAKRLAQISSGLSGRLHVSIVLRCCLLVDAPYWPGLMVDRGCDRRVVSFDRFGRAKLRGRSCSDPFLP